MSGCPGRPRGALSGMSRCPVVGNEPGHGFAPTGTFTGTTGTFGQFAGTSLVHSAGRRRYLWPCWLPARLRLVRIGRAFPARQHLTRRKRDMGRDICPCRRDIPGHSRLSRWRLWPWSCLPSAGLGYGPVEIVYSGRLFLAQVSGVQMQKAPLLSDTRLRLVRTPPSLRATISIRCA